MKVRECFANANKLTIKFLKYLTLLLQEIV